MASTYSDLKFELIGTGDQSGVWGVTTNDNIGTAIEQALVGLGNPVFTTDANLTISLTNTVALQTARALVLNATSSGSLTATRELVVPTIEKQYIVQNNTTGGQSITVKTTAGTGITVTNGRKAHLYVDGTNVIQMFDFVDINGGAIDATAIGATTPDTGSFTSLTDSGNLAFTGTGNRITGDFSTTTFANRVAFQTSTVNAGTAVTIIPNGTGTVSQLNLESDAAQANGVSFQILANTGGTENRLQSGIRGTGTYLPITFYTGGSERARIDSSGNVGIGTTSNTLNQKSVLYMAGAVAGYFQISNGALGLAATNGLRLGVTAAGLGELYAPTSLAYYINNTEGMRLNSTGLGIGTSSPAVKLDVNGITGWQGGTTGIAGSIAGASSGINNGGNLRILANTTQAANVGGALTLGGYYTSTTLSVDFGAILGAKENSTAGDAAGYLAFGTRPAGGNMTERARIGSNGDVLVTGTGTGSLGYGTGSGGTVTQATSKSTSVTLNKPTGQITMNNAALAASTNVSFTLTNSLIALTDTLICSITTASANYSYQIQTYCGAGIAQILLRNIDSVSRSEAIVINFAIIKGVTL